MKNLNYLFLGFFMIASFTSCEKENADDNFDLIGNKKAKPNTITEKMASSPESYGGVTPYIIPGQNRGGNRTCNEVGIAFMDNSDYFNLKSDKVDYNNGEFSTPFPQGLEVTTDGKFLSFEMENCILIEGNYYKVGAVIVKGSNHANVYFYEDGTLNDDGLAAPLNASGTPAGLSNLTFCFVECKQPEMPELVVALKTYYTQASDVGDFWAVTRGEGSDINTLRIGYNNYVYNEENIYKIFRYGYDNMPVGTLTISDYIDDSDGIHYLELVVTGDIDGMEFTRSYLYVGSVEGYNNYLKLRDGKFETLFASLPFFEDETSAIRIFKIPFSDLAE